MRNYDDIVNLTRPQYADLPPMSIHDRAAQFSPFAALVGYDDAVAETARLTDSRREISEDELSQLNEALVKLSENINKRPNIKVNYFIPDAHKDGGSYEAKTGNAKSIDQVHNIIEFTDGTKIPVSNMYSIIIVDSD